MKNDSFEKTFALGIEAFECGRFTEAAELLQQASIINPDNLRTYRVLGNCLRVLGRVEEAIDAYRRGQKVRYNFSTHNRLINALNYADIPQDVLIEEYRMFGEKFCQRYSRYKQNGSPAHATGTRIRIGYVSPDFRSHPVSYFMIPIIENHSPRDFSIYCYYNGKTNDNVTRQYQAAGVQWRDTAGMDTAGLYTQIVTDKIDVLVDLAGHTSGNRLDVFCLKPAPVQVTYLGYPNTTGLESIDYRIVDSVTDPATVPSSWHSEQLYRLDPCFLCFCPPGENAPILPSERQNVVFGTFNKIAKITDRIISSWVRILHAVPHSTFLIKSKGLETESEQEKLKARFAAAGMEDVHRVTTWPLTPSRTEHLQLYNRMDIALDTFPYNGTTTTIQALWMGVPVVTLQGDSHISRVSSSILSAVGRSAYIANSPEEYEQIAIDLAGDPERLSLNKHSLRTDLLRSTICDANTFVRKLEDAYRVMLKSKNCL